MGLGDINNRNLPTLIQITEIPIQISAGIAHSLIILTSNNQFGSKFKIKIDNDVGQLGIGIFVASNLIFTKMEMIMEMKYF